MSENPDSKTTTKTVAPPTAFQRITGAVAYPVSIAVGFLYGRTKMESHIYDNLMFHNCINDLRDPLLIEAKNIGTKAVDDIKHGVSVDIYENTKEMHHEYAAKVNQRIKQLQLGSNAEKWRFLQPHNKQNVLIDGFTAAGITLGVILTIANSKSVIDFIRNQQEDKSRTER